MALDRRYLIALNIAAALGVVVAAAALDARTAGTAGARRRRPGAQIWAAATAAGIAAITPSRNAWRRQEAQLELPAQPMGPRCTNRRRAAQIVNARS